MSKDVVKAIQQLTFPWQTQDPFLFCVHHLDHYPEGNGEMAPKDSLHGRQIGMDFSGKDGWSMYHGEKVPGFPMHPHRGFETITIARQGYIDHSDSLGATARFGLGDVQWMTAGNGVVHSEMFPLVHDDKPNPTELFQIWLNLPSAQKRVDGHFKMLWNSTIPKATLQDEDGKAIQLTVVAGDYQDLKPPAPPPHSWASQSESDIAIWTLKLAPGATFALPPAQANSNRSLYFFEGSTLQVSGETVLPHHVVELQADATCTLVNGAEETELLMLQGKPIGEPVVQQGPFVMNTREEIYETIIEYRRTGFGGWPWKSGSPVHPKKEGRFAIHADGSKEVPTD